MHLNTIKKIHDNVRLRSGDSGTAKFDERILSALFLNCAKTSNGDASNLCRQFATFVSAENHYGHLGLGETFTRCWSAREENSLYHLVLFYVQTLGPAVLEGFEIPEEEQSRFELEATHNNRCAGGYTPGATIVYSWMRANQRREEAAELTGAPRPSDEDPFEDPPLPPPTPALEQVAPAPAPDVKIGPPDIHFPERPE